MNQILRKYLPLCILACVITSHLDAEIFTKPTGDTKILPNNSTLKEIWNEGEFTEGVAVNSKGDIYFSDIAFNPKEKGRILKLDPQSGTVKVHCKDSGKSNGLFFDSKGRLIAACGANGGHRAIVEIKPDGTVVVIQSKFDGKQFNSPNDLVIDSLNNIYFSDPRYVGPEPIELDHQSVFRITPQGKVTRVTTNISKPNGVHISPDQKTLYVAETNNGSFDVTKTPDVKPKMTMTLNAFPLNANGTVGEKTQLADFGQEVGTDGMTVDTDGNVYAAVRSESRFGIVVYSPEGTERAFIPTPALPTNCTFGIGKQAHTLFVTAGGGLYQITLKTTGFHPTLKQK
ncbi:MAG: SMP-30/gluconolactonase/LRE family protein [Planctomycetaceae bacterium]|jgi:gluconolactonase|nr:SMP-30/gluconolactonase/LRE family protein [Planctomycetaceae bacterium]MDG2390471.1 SMP-30/gluconolactonase/LRE family protein [Planctomycetaceae bacterium]